MNPIRKLNGYLLERYDASNFLRFKRAQFITYFLYFYVGLLVLLSLISISFGMKRFLEMMVMTIPAFTSGILILFFIRKGRVDIAANILAIFSVLICVPGFLTKPPHMAGVSLPYFMYVDVVFSTLFCSALVSGFVLASFVGSHAVYFFLIAGARAEGILAETVRTSFVDGVVSLILVFVIGFVVTKFLEQAVRRSEQGKDESQKQYESIKALNAAIETTSQTLSESISVTSSAIERLSENSQNQAATMEELSATIEEISAGTENAAHATSDQNESLGRLITGFHEMSGFIDRLEKNGTEIAKMFNSIMKLAHVGEESSSRLDDINGTILQNSSEIQSVVTVMGEFFDKINLLALNATIEAARAGEQGRGFAVVAEEIGKLSDNSAGELKQISDLIGRNRSDVESGSKIIENIIVFIRTLLGNIGELQTKAADVLDIIKNQDSLRESMNMLADLVRQKSELINTSMQEQKTSIGDVVKSIGETNRSVQENTEATENLREGANELKVLTGLLHREFENAR